ncbi:hypothetical protein HPB49_015343 [Dermacentor silvarum]|uniref:Uncharacterized protein n=1 Tax=Dermacentor silvarum TaxID=543639 RepID=A0ACB8CRT5_DERSI|nr:hypothetical protein HPB49_015343 [Dermacentor silvarum]
MDSAKGRGEVELAVPGADRAPLSSPAGSVDQLLHQTAEEEEMEAKGLNTSGEMDFLILDEVKVDEEQEGSSELQEPMAKSAEIEEPVRTSTPKHDAEGSFKGDRECEKDLQLSVEDGDEDAASASSCGEGGAKKAGNGKAWGVKQEGDNTALMIQDEDEPEKSKGEPELKKDVEELLEGAVTESPAQVDEELAEAEKSLDSSDDVQVVSFEQLADKESMKKDVEVEKLDSAKENKMPVLNGTASVLKDEDPDDPDPVDSNADDVDSKPPKRSASSHGILADLKRALSMIDAESGKPKRFKLDMDDGSVLKQEEGVHPSAASAAVVAASGESVGVPVGPSLVVLNRKQLEQYVSRRVRECLVTQATALLQPMEKKCDTLHRALERWRRRSFQLQKQLNEFVSEQEKCANARRSRRSVGVCVRMPPLKPQAPTPASPGIKTIPTTVMAPTSVTSRAPSVTATRASNVTVSTVASGSTSPARPLTPAQQIRVTGTNASMLAAQLGLKPNQHMKLVKVSTPSGGSTAVVTRMPPQLQSAPSSSTSVSSSVPVPMQLIANTANMTGSSSPAMKVGVTTSSATSPAGTSVRTVAVVSSAASGTSSASGVKIIDLTQEEEAANAHAKALSASGVSLGNALHKIVSSSSIPVLSAAPTSLVQVSSTSSPSTTRVSIAGTSVVLSHMTGGTVTQAGGNTLRLGSSPLVGPPARVTVLSAKLAPWHGGDPTRGWTTACYRQWCAAHADDPAAHGVTAGWFHHPYSQSEAVVLSPRHGGGTILIQRGPCWWCCLLALCELSWRAVVMACAKRQNLSFAAKLEIINRVKRGEKKSDVAAAYKIPRSTLSTILKNKADIRTKSDKRPGARGARRVRTAVYEDVEAATARAPLTGGELSRNTFETSGSAVGIYDHTSMAPRAPLEPSTGRRTALVGLAPPRRRIPGRIDRCARNLVVFVCVELGLSHVVEHIEYDSTGTTAELTDVEIVAKVTAEQPNKNAAEMDPASADDAPLPTSAESGAIEGTGLSLVDRLDYIEDAVVKHAIANKKQATLFQYFKRTQ